MGNLDLTIHIFACLFGGGVILFFGTCFGLGFAAKSGRFSMSHWGLANSLWCLSFAGIGGAGTIVMLSLIAKFATLPSVISEMGIFIAGGVWVSSWLVWFTYINRIDVRHESWRMLIRMARKARRRRPPWETTQFSRR